MSIRPLWRGLWLSRRQTLLAMLFPLLACAAYYSPRWIAALCGPLPRYVLVVSGGLSESCCASADGRSPVKARPDSPIDLVLRPERAPAGPVFVQAFRLVRGESKRLSLWMKEKSSGAMHLRGLAGDVLDLEPGSPAAPERIELVFAISRSPILRSYESLQTEASDRTGAATQLLRGTITVVPALPLPRP